MVFLQLRLTGVQEISDNAGRRCREGDSISAAVWLDVPPENAVLPEAGKSYRFCLFTGTDANPLDSASRAVDLQNTWMIYGSYIGSTAAG